MKTIANMGWALSLILFHAILSPKPILKVNLGTDALYRYKYPIHFLIKYIRDNHIPEQF